MSPLSLSIGLELGNSQVEGFSAADLFGPGDTGFLWQGGDPSRGFLFQDAAGTTPCTEATDPIGLLQDESGNGEDFSQATAGSRLILEEDPADVWTMQGDGVADFLEASPFFYDANGATMVLTILGNPQQSKCIYGEGNSGDNNPFIAFQSGGVGNNDNLAVVYSDDTGTLRLAVTGDAVVLDGTWHVISLLDTGDSFHTWVDGEEDINVNYTRAATTLDRSSLHALARSNVVNFLAADLAIYGIGIGRMLSASERQSMERAVGAYVGLSL